MRTIRLLKHEDVPEFIRIGKQAYPGFASFSDTAYLEYFTGLLHDVIDHPDNEFYYACTDNDKIVGIFKWINYQMNFFGNLIPVTGIGFVAVDLSHKKEHIAKDILTYFTNESKKKENFIATLYPFRPDFYYQMGYGHGNKVYSYAVAPNQLPFSQKATKAKLITIEDKDKIKACYDKVANTTHGTYKRSSADWTKQFRNPNLMIAATFQNNEITGYMLFTFKKIDFLNIELIVHEIIHQDADAFLGLMSFLKTQQDQISSVILAYQEPDLIFAMNDPRNQPYEILAPLQHNVGKIGVGIMYHVLNAKEIAQLYPWNITCDTNVRLIIHDPFVKENTSDFVLSISKGKATLSNEKADSTVKLSIQTFSSLFTGSVSFAALLRLAMVELDGDREKILQLFGHPTSPKCYTYF